MSLFYYLKSVISGRDVTIGAKHKVESTLHFLFIFSFLMPIRPQFPLEPRQ